MDIPGTGQIRGWIKTSLDGCGKACSEESNCCSFEYSFSKKICNLNIDCEPTSPRYQDYVFCSKNDGKGILKV